MSNNETILEIRNLKKYFFSGKKHGGRELRAVKVLDEVSFSMECGETLGMVGGSGCGKFTLGRAVLRPHEPMEGQVVYRERNLTEYDREEMHQMRRELQIIFQDPYSLLNPRMTVRGLICAPLDVFAMGLKEEKEVRVIKIMDKVGLPLEFMNRYPREFSGGQRQRIVITRALTFNPGFAVCDESVSALDVSVQAQVLSLMMGLQKKLDLTYLFTSHDLNMVRYIYDRTVVMYPGNVIEVTGKKVLYEDAEHPYTQAPPSATPIPGIDIEYNRIHLEGDMPSPFDSPQDCRLHTRCRYTTKKCRVQIPESKDMGDRRFVVYHLYDE